MRSGVVCKECGQLATLHGNKMCEVCYFKLYYKKNKDKLKKYALDRYYRRKHEV